MITTLLQWRPGKGLHDPRTALPDPDRSARGEGYLNATSSPPRPLALVPPVFRKSWRGRTEAPLKSCRIFSATPWRWLSLCARYQGLHARRMVRCDYSDVEQAWALDDTRPPASTTFVNLLVARDGVVGLPWSTAAGASPAPRVDKTQPGQLHHQHSLERRPVVGVGAAFAGSEFRTVDAHWQDPPRI